MRPLFKQGLADKYNIPQGLAGSPETCLKRLNPHLRIQCLACFGEAVTLSSCLEKIRPLTW